MLALRTGRFVARIARSDDDLRAAQRLRHLSFIDMRPGSQPRPDGLDADRFDADCHHVLIEEEASGEPVCCFRLLLLESGDEIARSYSAQFYELSGLRDHRGRLAELGRFCIHPDRAGDPDILRLAWAAMARIVDAAQVELLFGCASFEGTDAARHHDAFVLLKERHIAPRRWLPRIKAPKVFPFARRLRDVRANPRSGLAALPPLLRSYLAMGGWVSDHAVVDPDLNTLHVFTGLEIRAIPAARARWLRATAASA